jgi:glycosyltransferase involved in cell wall biosynthesis
MARKRVLVVHPYVTGSGGGNVVAAWALEALRDEFAVTLATLGPVDCAAVNRNFGTSLKDGDFAVRIAPGSYKALERSIPTRGALLEIAMVMRWARALDRRERFDVLLSTQNEMDFHRPGVQYVHFPWVFLPRPEQDMRWFHYLPGFLSGYRGLCRLIARSSKEGLRRNLSLANSEFVAGRIRQILRTDSVILYPPVPGEFPDVRWEKRCSAAVAIGRMAEYKRWEMAVEIVERVRRQGIDLSLTLISHREQAAYERRIAALASDRPWFRILFDLSRFELAAEVASHRYGIHCMEGEHFGIAVAEMLRAGVVPFVHDSGGQVEIVGGRRELCFRDAADGAEKIASVMTQASLESDLRQQLLVRRDCFSADRFCSELRSLVRSFQG